MAKALPPLVGAPLTCPSNVVCYANLENNEGTIYGPHVWDEAINADWPPLERRQMVCRYCGGRRGR